MSSTVHYPFPFYTRHWQSSTVESPPVAPQFSYQVRRRGSTAVIAMTGQFCLASAPVVDDAVDDLIALGDRRLVFDLAAVDFMDSQGLHVLLRAHARMQDLSGEMLRAAPSARVVRVLEVAEMKDHFPTTPYGMLTLVPRII